MIQNKSATKMHLLWKML